MEIDDADRLMLQHYSGDLIPVVRNNPEHPRVIVRTDSPVSFVEMKEQLLSIQDFVSFGIGRAAIVEHVELTTEDGRTLKYFGKWRAGRDHTNGSRLTNLLFSLDRVDFDTAMRAWYFALDNLYPAPQVIVYRYYQPGFLEHDLSASVSAIENMYKQLGYPLEIKHDQPDGADAIRTLINDAQASDAKSSAMNALRGRKQAVRFAEKLRELSSLLPPSVFETLRFTSEDWIEGVREQRNNVSHTASHVTRPGSNARVDLERGVARSRILLMLLIMNSSGFSRDHVERAIKDLIAEADRTSS
ncbi:HEPN domain-containing protein [Mycetocola tolaasinivorans]|uniref:ApeA N-terminal domain 1-containing protein n=1 Tax=Mycetocola tolaasinivorans TaxID=76635 RepID=UPI0011C3A756|nr:HEPN domain-containing protein [Mycetocola tolaasinivorans]